MKKTRCLIPFLLLAFLFLLCTAIGCSARKSPQPLSSVPTFEELLAFRDSHSADEYTDYLLQIQELIDQTPDEELYRILEDSLIKWKETQTIFPLERVELNFSRNPLLMDLDKNKRVYNDVLVTLVMYYDPAQLTAEEETVMRELHYGSTDALRETVYGKFKIYSLESVCADSTTDFWRQDRRSNRFKLFDETMTPKLPKEELKIQDFVYGYLTSLNERVPNSNPPFGNIVLEQFGLRPNSKDLYMDIYISMPLYPDVEQSLRTVKESADEISRSILSDEASANYLKRSGIETITIELRTSWAKNSEDKHKIFSYAVTEP